ncbi:MAG: hypothetical protein M1838_001592 [Thelocarpon superellum]|nr:MAG: hypothetical protein M1838_001592 [Thelocarpon superellum]
MCWLSTYPSTEVDARPARYLNEPFDKRAAFYRKPRRSLSDRSSYYDGDDSRYRASLMSEKRLLADAGYPLIRGGGSISSRHSSLPPAYSPPSRHSTPYFNSHGADYDPSLRPYNSHLNQGAPPYGGANRSLLPQHMQTGYNAGGFAGPVAPMPYGMRQNHHGGSSALPGGMRQLNQTHAYPHQSHHGHHGHQQGGGLYGHRQGHMGGNGYHHRRPESHLSYASDDISDPSYSF